MRVSPYIQQTNQEVWRDDTDMKTNDETDRFETKRRGRKENMTENYKIKRKCRKLWWTARPDENAKKKKLINQ